MQLLDPSNLRLRSWKMPLRWVLVIPFVIQTVGAIGLVGYLSYLSGRQLVEKLADQLMDEVNDRVHDRLETYLQASQQAVALNRLAVEQGTLNLNDSVQLRNHLWQQLNLSPSLGSTMFFSEQGEQLGYGRLQNQEIRAQAETLTGKSLPIGTPFFTEISRVQPGIQNYYQVDWQGIPQRLVYSLNIDNRTTAWYRHVKNLGKQSWSPVLVYRVLPMLGLYALAPVYDKAGNFQGVFSSDVFLSEISVFLSELNFSASGQTFIIERSGDLVASSTRETPYVLSAKGTPTRLSVLQSQNTQIRSIAQQLAQQLGGFNTVQAATQLYLKVDSQRQFVQIAPYRDGYGVDWLVVTVIPESDFSSEIELNNARTVFLCWLALFAVAGIGALAARRITAPILRLSKASQALARGEWQQPLSDQTSIAELKALTQAFNLTAEQLQRSFERTKIALYESEDKFAKIFRTSPDAIGITSLANDSYLEVNDHFLTVTGYAREEVIGHTALELGLITQPEVMTEIHQRLQVDRAIHNFEIELATKSGEIKTGLMSSELIDLEGRPCLLSVYKDYSDRKRAETILRQREQEFRALVENAPDVIARFDRSFRYLYINPGIEKETGIPVAAFIGKTSQELFLPESIVEQWHQKIQQVFDTGKEQTLEYTLLTLQRPSSWLARIVPEFDADGSVQTVLFISRDITELKQIETALRESEERFRRAFDDAAIGMALIAPNGRFLSVNHSLCDMVGYSEAELLSLSFQDITHPDDLNADLAAASRVLAGEQRIYQVEKRYIHKLGQIVWVLICVSLVRDPNGEPLYSVSQIQDISERHQIDRIKDEFISVVSHELRTPLTAIRGSLGVLEAGVFKDRPERARKMLLIALNNSDRLVRLVNDILDLERLESGKTQLVMEKCNLADLMQQAVDTVQSIAQKASITLDLTPLAIEILAAPDAIVQILTNLLGNAIKFSVAGGTVWLRAELVEASVAADKKQGRIFWRQHAPTVSLSLPVSPPLLASPTLPMPLPYVLLSVQDQGRGIPADKLETIFGRFQQVDASDSRQKGGTGLGLAICKSIVQQHGGQIWVESQLNQGSTFYFTLPTSPTQ